MIDVNKKISEIISPFEKRIAIKAKGRKDLDYLSLKKIIINNSDKLNNLSKNENKIFSYVVSPGPEAITVFLTLIEKFSAAPLNPNYTKQEFISYLKDIKCDAIIIEKDKFNNAIEAANELKIHIIYLETLNKSGNFELSYLNNITIKDDKKSLLKNKERLILHTSGTTSKPKTVSLSQENIFSSALNIIKTLKLCQKDSCLNIMPLFHIHGLIGCVLSTILSGGTIIASKGFNALTFFSYVEQFNPSWFSAVPAMHKMIIRRKSADKNIFNNLRFIRSSSAPMPIKIIDEIEKYFNCTLLEAYGMTEASHQITSNKLDKIDYKKNTLGRSQGVEISVLTKEGKIKFLNAKGEILIKGKNVIKKYRNYENANHDSFYKGWFKTGDEGIIDNDGFLKISGRIKEIINKGGEKISPFEIDEVLLLHKEIEEAVTFSIPNEKYGEVICCALVLQESSTLNDKKVIEFLMKKISSFKIPDKIFIIKEIPKNSTGKVKRLDMPYSLGLL